MAESPSSRHITALADRVMAAAGYRNRLRELRATGSGTELRLADELCERAFDISRDDPAESGQAARLAARLSWRLGDRERWAVAFRRFAQAEVLRGENRSALRALDRVVAVRNGSADPEAALALDLERLQPLINLEDHRTARETGDRLLAEYEKRGDRKGEIRVRMSLADLEFRLDRPRRALRHYARIHALLPEDAPPGILGAVAMNRANALEACHRLRGAARQFQIAKGHFEALDARHSIAQVDYNLAYAEMLRGRFRDALRRYTAAELRFAEFEDERHLAHADLDRAELHLRLNLPDDAQQFASRAERRFLAQGLRKEAAQAAQFSGIACRLSGDLESAERELQRSLASFTELGMSERRVRCQVALAEIAEQIGRTGDARRLVEEAGRGLERTAGPLTSLSVSLLAARLDLEEHDPATARETAEKVLATCRRVFAPWIAIEAHRILGRALVLAGRHDAAVAAYRDGIEELERYRGGVPPDEYMAAFLSARSGLYAEIVDLLVRTGEVEEAYRYAERAKSRALLDLLSGLDERGKNLDPGATAERRLQYLRERLTAVYQKLFHTDGGGEERSLRALREAKRQAGKLEDEIARLLRRLRLGDEEAASLHTVVSPDLGAVREVLGDDTALLEYFLTEDRLFTFLVTKDSLHVLHQEADADWIRARLERLQFHLGKYQRPKVTGEALLLEATRANLAELSELLVAPLEGKLRSKRIVVVPHGPLHHVPFHALPCDDGWLIDEHEIVYAPSAAVYRFCADRENVSGRGASVFGVPDAVAPEIEDEARTVARTLRTDRLFLGEYATIDRVRKEASTTRILHIATHGMFRQEQPMLSSIRLSDGWLNLYDLYDLEVNGELVVLSTCESGIAEVTPGDEILGLSRGFLHAGAPALLTSQWRVNDAATAEFMKAFYHHLEEEGDAATAHRAAMLELRERRPHPYFWAPFFLTGRPLPAGERGRTRKHRCTEANREGPVLAGTDKGDVS